MRDFSCDKKLDERENGEKDGQRKKESNRESGG
jgi:hypothetical protein